MTKKDARKEGIWAGENIVSNGDFTAEELSSEDKFLEACYEIESNQRQYAGHITYDFTRDSEYDGYDDGLSIAFQSAAKKRFK